MLKKKTVKATKLYNLTVHLNGLVFKKRTNDLDKTIVDLKPEQLHTEVYITVKKGKDVMDRRLNLQQGRNLFNNEDFRQVFISNLLFI